LFLIFRVDDIVFFKKGLFKVRETRISIWEKKTNQIIEKKVVINERCSGSTDDIGIGTGENSVIGRGQLFTVMKFTEKKIMDLINDDERVVESLRKTFFNIRTVKNAEGETFKKIRCMCTTKSTVLSKKVGTQGGSSKKMNLRVGEAT
jgi:hypothetical protein